MKRINYLLVLLAAFSIMTSCKNVNYKKTKSGLLYKIFPGDSKDSLIKNGQIVKFNYTVKLNDSLLMTSHGSFPAYQGIQQMDRAPYNLLEILTKMKKGDSAVTVQSVDTLIRLGMQNQLPPTAQKGDRLVTGFVILNVFSADSTARADFDKEREKADAVEIAKGLKDMDTWLASKKIDAQKTGKGTYVHIDQPGTGPAVEIGKYVNVKYTGKALETDSAFQTGTYAIKLGSDPVIQGWLEGLQLFKQGGKGTLYIPGFLAYGRDPGPANKPYAPLLFDVEILQVSDQPIPQTPAAPQPAK